MPVKHLPETANYEDKPNYNAAVAYVEEKIKRAIKGVYDELAEDVVAGEIQGLSVEGWKKLPSVQISYYAASCGEALLKAALQNISESPKYAFRQACLRRVKDHKRDLAKHLRGGKSQ
jgi:hypothetical protein